MARSDAEETGRRFRKVFLKKMEPVYLQFRCCLVKKLRKATFDRGNIKSKDRRIRIFFFKDRQVVRYM